MEIPDYEPIPIAELPPLRDAWFLTGSTASGKTTVGIDLAERLNAEIISLDSMALFQGMDIGTAKPTLEQRQRVPHHLLDVLTPDRDFSLANYVELAHATARQIRDRGREALFVGGTPLYLKSLLRGICTGPSADWGFREEIEREIAIVGVEALHERLRQVDPLAAARLHPHDKRRIIRALEVNRLTGRPISHLQTQFDEGVPAGQCRVFVLDWPRFQLHARIADRVESMFAAGLLDEVEQLVWRFGTLSRTAAQAVGYREAIEHLRGERDLTDTIELVKSRTRQFARRQETWFRSLCECRRVPMSIGSTAAAVAGEILRTGRSEANPRRELGDSPATAGG